MLLGQREGLDKAFEGPIQRYRWSGGKLAPAAPYALPPDLTILGFGLWDINKDGALEVIEVGEGRQAEGILKEWPGGFLQFGSLRRARP